MTGLDLFLIYVIGFSLTLAFLKVFGKKIGIDYSRDDDDSYYEDWGSNAEAYTVFSLLWVILVPIGIIIGLWRIFIRLIRIIIKD